MLQTEICISVNPENELSNSNEIGGGRDNNVGKKMMKSFMDGPLTKTLSWKLARKAGNIIKPENLVDRENFFNEENISQLK